jgi:hypothetical protein|tara:strand:+ start:563 stop:706 length:144 start_codon:yes stop_codon:yes gene_type:complete
MSSIEDAAAGLVARMDDAMIACDDVVATERRRRSSSSLETHRAVTRR